MTEFVLLTGLPAAVYFLIWLARNGGDLYRTFRPTSTYVEGVPGVATVLDVADTGVVLKEQPVMRMSLRVEVPGVAPYDAVASTMVPSAAVGFLRPGARVAVRVDPTSPTTLAVDLTHMSLTAASIYAAA